jgi:hypothetical protein
MNLVIKKRRKTKMKNWRKLIEIFEKFNCDPQYIAECVYVHPDSDEKNFKEELIQIIEE